MTSADLSSQQAARLRAIAARNLRFLNRLSERMTRLGFPPNDPLVIATERARDGMQHLHVAAHYAECKQRVG